MNRRLAYILIAVLLLMAVGVMLTNHVRVNRSLSNTLAADPRNNGIVAYAHYNQFVVPDKLVFDLRSVGETTAPGDIFRVLLQFAAAQKDNAYSTITLSFKGTPKFMLKGDYFHTLGVEYGTQNPVYTMRTLPENVYRLDGTAAFGTWTGGVLGVLTKQIEDFTKFHRQWYIEDLGSRGGKMAIEQIASPP